MKATVTKLAPRFLLASVLLGGILAQPRVFAQELEDAIENELDQMKKGAPSSSSGPQVVGSPTPAPSEPPLESADQSPNLAPSGGTDKESAETSAPDLDSSIESELESAVGAGGESAAPAVVEPTQTRPAPVAKPDPTLPEKKAQVPSPAPVIEESPKPTVTQEPAITSDQPNLELEARLYRIYQKAQPISADRWSQVLGARREDIYKVQPGDTLWDISKTMFGDGFFWSKLWAENSALENPHRIEKGRAIRFIGGNEAEAPSLNLVKDSTPLPTIRLNTAAVSKGEAPMFREDAFKEYLKDSSAKQADLEIDELVSAPEIPKGRDSRPVTKLPPSFEFPEEATYDSKYNVNGIDIVKNASLTKVPMIVPTSFILDKDTAGVGSIEEIETGVEFASAGQYVFLKLTRPARVGDKFSTVFKKGFIKDPVLGEVGPVMETGGVIEVVETIDPAKRTFRAVVLRSWNPVRLGSLVLQEPLPLTNYSRKGTLLGKSVRIIGGELDEDRKVIGESSVVYLDGGARAGLTPGDLLPIHGRRDQRRQSTKFSDWKNPIGVVKIVKVEPTLATAIVLEAQEEITPGDRTGGSLPQMKHPISHQDESED